MQQLARNRNQGGLKLQLPALKCKSLLVSRHLHEIGSIPFYFSFITRVNPTPPADCPCLKVILQNKSLLPLQLQQNTSSNLIHSFYVSQTETPWIMRLNPTADWRKIWTKISGTRMTSAAGSGLYLLVNGKTEHRRLMQTIGRADGVTCLHSGTPVETLEHKFSTCPRVAAAWTLLQRKTAPILQRMHALTFTDVLKPELNNIGLSRRTRILQLINGYINFINTVYRRIDVNALDFFLNCEV